MVTVQYSSEVAYTHDPLSGDLFPILPLQIANPHDPRQALDTNAYLDSGAQRSLFDGWIATALGFDLFSGPELRYASVTGASLAARLHTVSLTHPNLGSVELEVGFSTAPISRNLLGRDFFNFFQIGVHERYLTLYLSPTSSR
jgi:hypothetical protein